MATIAKVIQFGRFQLDSQSRLLFKDGEELALEPKLIDVLQYLAENRDRYVPLNELHDEVWAGRIVTDTAVRRTISKLRNALDDDVNEPLYIKSLPKRGYRLIADLTVVPPTNGEIDDVSAQDTPTVGLDQPSSESDFPGPIQASDSVADQLTRGTGARLTRAVALVVAIIGLLVAVYFVASQPDGSQDGSGVQVLAIDEIDSIEAQKYSLSVSKNGRYLVYSARADLQESFQLYLQDMVSGSVTRLTSVEGYVSQAEFVSNNSAVAYVNVTDNASQLNLARLDGDSAAASHTVASNLFDIGNLELDRSSGAVFAPIFSSAASATIYQINMNTGEFQEVSFSDQPETADYRIALSPKAEKYAYARGAFLENYFAVHVFNKASGELLLNLNWDSLILDMEWLDESRFLVLDQKRLSILDVVSGDVQTLLENSFQSITQIDVDDQQRVWALKQVPAEKFERRVNVADFNTQSELVLKKLVMGSSFHFDDNKRFWIQQENSGYSLNEYDATTDEVTQLLTSSYSFQIYDLDRARQAVLLMHNGRLAVYYRPTREVKYLTNQSQFVEDARFTGNGTAVFFGEKHASGWQIRYYDLISEKVSVYLRGYRSLRSYGSGFLAADQDGQLFQLSGDLETAQPLELTVSFAYMSSWDVIANHLVLSELLGDDTVITSLNLITLEKSVIKDNVASVSPQLFFDLEGAEVSFRSKRLAETKVIVITLGAD